KTKNNELIKDSIIEFRIELRGYRSLKDLISNKLNKYIKIESEKRKAFKKRRYERTSNFGHESYGSILSISKGMRI
ncbi:MAG: hypothetical protein HRT40_09175, partial [Campylobacteraceae bacterium]|nr:hypothetical protein [Campylobacteraceae bacterium]